MFSSSILNCDKNGGAVGRISKAAFVGRNSFVDCVGIGSVRETDLDVDVLEPETRIDIGCDFVVGLHDIFYVYIHEIVEGVYMLLNQALDFQESRKE